jgi:hypothetical protein
MAKRQPVNSIAGQVAAMANSRAPLDPPSHVPLDPDAAGFWKDIVAARSREEWTSHDLAFAADLANAMARLHANRKALRAEGEVTANASGTPMVNPRAGVVQSLHAQVKAARQSLGLHSAAKGDQRDVLRRRALSKEAENAADDAAADDLLARPSTH